MESDRIAKIDHILDIPIQVEHSARSHCDTSSQSFDLDQLAIQPILLELKQALSSFQEANMASSSENYLIDLGALPISAKQRNKLLELLGQGEVSIDINAEDAIAGKSKIKETQIAGVWIVEHFDEKDKTESMFIEVGSIPNIVLCDKADIRADNSVLQQLLDTY